MRMVVSLAWATPTLGLPTTRVAIGFEEMLVDIGSPRSVRYLGARPGTRDPVLRPQRTSSVFPGNETLCRHAKRPVQVPGP